MAADKIIHGLQERLKEVVTRNAELQAQLRNFEEVTSSRAESLQSRIADLESEVEELKDEKRNLKQELRGLEDAPTDKNNLEDLQDSLQRMYKVIDPELKDLDYELSKGLTSGKLGDLEEIHVRDKLEAIRKALEAATP